jgi:hypothetical protein
MFPDLEIVMRNVNINTILEFAGHGKESMPLWSLSVAKGDLVAVNMGEAAGMGGDTDYICSIILTCEVSFQCYELGTPFIGGLVDIGDDCMYLNSESKAKEFIEKIKLRGVVDLDYWNPINDNAEIKQDEFFDDEELAQGRGR